jgi:hypothetical protein
LLSALDVVTSLAIYRRHISPVNRDTNERNALKTMFVLLTIAAPMPRPETSAAVLGCALFAQRGYRSVERKHAGSNWDPCALDPGGAG